MPSAFAWMNSRVDFLNTNEGGRTQRKRRLRDLVRIFQWTRRTAFALDLRIKVVTSLAWIYIYTTNPTTALPICFTALYVITPLHAMYPLH